MWRIESTHFCSRDTYDCAYSIFGSNSNYESMALAISYIIMSVFMRDNFTHRVTFYDVLQ